MKATGDDARRRGPMPEQDTLKFDGETFEPERDRDRLLQQLGRVKTVMADREWHTLGELADKTHSPQASVSARLRDLRKPRFGGHTVERRYIDRGVFEYRIAG